VPCLEPPAAGRRALGGLEDLARPLERVELRACPHAGAEAGQMRAPSADSSGASARSTRRPLVSA
jgi:hypothetical protein